MQYTTYFDFCQDLSERKRATTPWTHLYLLAQTILKPRHIRIRAVNITFLGGIYKTIYGDDYLDVGIRP